MSRCSVRVLCATALLSWCVGATGCRRASEPTDPAPPPAEATIELSDADIDRNNRGVALMGQYAYGPALEIFQSLVEAHPAWLEARVNLAIATLNRQDEGDEQRAIEMLTALLEEAPEHLEAGYVLALLQFRNGETEVARDLLQVVVDRDPEDGYAWYFLGQTLEQEDADRALSAYERSRALEPYLRSAYFRSAAVLRMLGRDDEADEMLEVFQTLDGNPRARTARFIYTEMGPRANAIAVNVADPIVRPRPEGPVFAPSRPLLDEDHGDIWNDRSAARSITVADIDGDGRLDLFLADALRVGTEANAVILQQEEGRFTLARDHLLASFTDVRAALFGDVNNNGLLDVYLCRRGSNQLLMRTEEGWRNETFPAGVAGEDLDTVDGVLADLDHDGDLDIFCVNADGPDELFMNNLDGTFRAIASSAGLSSEGRVSRGIVVADLDGSRDLDIFVLHDVPPHSVFMNDRLWNWDRRAQMAALESADVVSAVAMDLEVTGRPDIFTMSSEGTVSRWRLEGGEMRRAESLRLAEEATSFGLLDVRGDGVPGILLPDGRGGMADRAWGEREEAVPASAAEMAWAPILLDVRRGWSVVTRAPGAAPMLLEPGSGRHDFTAMILVGRDDPGNAMRTNASGIGARAFARRGSHWSPVTSIRPVSGPGQSLQPWPVGLGGAEALDFVLIDWPDGIFQTEVRGTGATAADGERSFAAGVVERIAETQRQVSSCPVIFAWDGEQYVFVSDLLGVGGIGYLLAPGVYAEPRPWENFQLPLGLPVPKPDGRLVLKLTEPMEEATYMDHVALAAWDLPPGWSMVLDERLSTGEPMATGKPVFFRREVQPVRAMAHGRDVLGELLEADLLAVDVGPLDSRFLGRLAEPLVLEVDFAEALDGIEGEPVLVIDGWVEYAYSQTMFAAWQAGATYESLSVEARDGAGDWHLLLDRFGYPAGMPRRMSVPLPSLPAGTNALRLSTNQEVYIDRLSVVFAEPCPEAVRHVSPLDVARLAIVGFPRRVDGPQRQPFFDYSDRTPFWDVRYQSGWYTREGCVLELVTAIDDAVAIFGPGEELHLEFLPPGSDPEPGWSRQFVLEVRGWCKDMDLFTRDGETLEPLPMSGPDSAARQELHRLYNTRFESGRSHR